MAASLAWLAAAACSAWVVAGLIWRYAAPAPVLLPVADDGDAVRLAQDIAGRRVFVGQADDGASPAPGVPDSRLIGLATGFAGGQAFALLAAGDNPPGAVLEGEEIAPGLRLRRILADRVEVDRDGIPDVLTLPSPTATLKRATESRPGGKPLTTE